jgi:hypothetical protein
MKCPHCNQGIHRNFTQHHQFGVAGQLWQAFYQACPECTEAIIEMEAKETVPRYTVYPVNPTARPLPPEVPDPYNKDFYEAVAVLSLSPKASAALSRRNLQAVLRDKAATKAKDLYDQIEEVINSSTLPSHIADDLHAVRNIGNFAAHEIQSKVTGAIVDVEVGEAEWNLDVLESLFDFYFVEPTKAAKRKADLNKKLKEAGKPTI